MSEQQFTTPILFLIFNRPDTTTQVFQQIRAVKPKYLYVAADGPRSNKPGEEELCQQARDVVLNYIDWNCELKTRFQEKNLGCKLAVSSAVTWFFQNVEEGIILEDDCLPDLSFFNFCKTLLEYYRDNYQIMHIGGANFQKGKIRSDGSYYFSKINHVWGWATWKRAWKLYDLNLATFPTFRDNNGIKKYFQNSRLEKFWEKRFTIAYENKIDTWDIQWQYAMCYNNGLSIIPNYNLVSNIGFGQVGTHTSMSFHPLANIPRTKLDKIIHPSDMTPNIEADVYSSKIYFAPNKIRKLLYIVKNTVHKKW